MFDNEGRHYSCFPKERRGVQGESWWWFEVDGDPQTYAPFMVAGSDTRATVRDRIVAFYTSRLHALSQPPTRGGHWGRHRPAAAKPAEPPPESTPGD